jgi:hypothetical protein
MVKRNGQAQKWSKVNPCGWHGPGHGIVATQLRVKQQIGSDKLSKLGCYEDQKAVAASVTIVKNGPCYSVN